MSYDVIVLTDEMLGAAANVGGTGIARTKSGYDDKLIGDLGEMAFCEWFTGDWRNHEIGHNHGRADYDGIVEVKCSAIPFRDTLNLLVREDYMAKHPSEIYTQLIIDLPALYAKIAAGQHIILGGFAYREQIAQAPLKDHGSKFGDGGGYRCHHIPIKALEPMTRFREAFQTAKEASHV